MGPLRAIVAPGKLLLAGEYAVLDGGSALVLAIHRGVRCTVWPVAPGGGRVVVTPGDDRFAVAGLEAVDAPPARYVFADEHPTGLPDKPGFGGSAAATVAAVLAGGGRGSEAFEAHRGVQDGGSGADVAASLSGGLIRYRAGAVVPLPLVDPLPAVVWSGASAATAPRVAAYRAWRADRSAFLQGMEALVEAFSEDPVAAVREARGVLDGMTRSARIVWETEALRRIADIAESLGGAAKPSGAGGGDCAIAVFPDAERRERFEVAVADAGYRVIPIRPAPAAGPVLPLPGGTS
ncbi:MAG: hypothetical protein JXB39_09735 [Deltaproteobacteria bacterium]|nr:hypothetical protein [Deltaproteobacteria bacterium]